MIQIRNEQHKIGRFEEKDGIISFREDINGFWTIHKDPIVKHFYCIGADVAEGKQAEGSSNDNHAAQILDNNNLEQVATYHGNKDDPDQFAEELYKAGYFYNTALIAPEINMEGGVIRNLERRKYPKLYMRERQDTLGHEIEMKFGWRTDKFTRNFAVSDLIEYVREHVQLINCVKTIDEMLTFVRDEKGKPAAQSGKHDDLVMSYAIALQACISGQQQRAVIGKVIDSARLSKLEEDLQEDYYSADEKTKKMLADKWKLWKEV